jgi:hypothetical protein
VRHTKLLLETIKWLRKKKAKVVGEGPPYIRKDEGILLQGKVL